LDYKERPDIEWVYNFIRKELNPDNKIIKCPEKVLIWLDSKKK